MSLGIVIVNYRTPQLTLDCLTSVAAQINDVPETRVALVDNASGDSSVSFLRDAIARYGWNWIKLVTSPVNRGFAGGTNLGLEALKQIQPQSQFILLLNSDAMLKPNVLRYVVEQMQADPTVGVMSCMLLNSDHSVQNTARRFPTPARLAAYSLGLPWHFPRAFAWADLDEPGWDRRTLARDVDWVGGAFMLIRRQTLDGLGPLDERFFFYGEDAEFCHRAWKHGWRVRYDPGAAAVHLGSASSDPTRLAARHRNAFSWQARYQLQRRCYGRLAEMFIRAVDIASFGLRYLKLRLSGRQDSPECAAQRDILTLLLRWPAAQRR
ncbi:MAG: glycosyltransferase family 2 protein [Tepidisphaeraceae bacterium]|jgi:GT2 family glycosyltransferase